MVDAVTAQAVWLLSHVRLIARLNSKSLIIPQSLSPTSQQYLEQHHSRSWKITRIRRTASSKQQAISCNLTPMPIQDEAIHPIFVDCNYR